MSKVLLGISGSIAAYKACELISLLKKEGHEVKVVVTKSALNFVGTASLEGLSGERVFTDTFEEGQMMSHIHLARWADVFILAPTSLAQLSRLAHGLADNLITNIYFALKSEVPRYVVPAMNTQMWENSKTQELISAISNDGAQILYPNSGQLACGETGSGRMQEPKEIFNFIFKNKSKGRVLITSGGTKVPIDSVRYIGNYSTGRTGAQLADDFSKNGYEVHLLHSKGACLPKTSNIKLFSYETFTDLAEKSKQLLGELSFQLIVHAAAVSDFSVKGVFDKKIVSDEELQIELVPNIKIISHLKDWAHSKTPIVGFKLTDQGPHIENQAAIKKLLFDCDYVVHNSMKDILAGNHRYSLHSKNGLIADNIILNDLTAKILPQINYQPSSEVSL